MKVSVVTPSYNQAQFVERTIQSVLSQDLESLEYVIFDGGSTDGTVDILKRYDGRLKWVSQPDGGQADAVNKAIAATSGEIIGWLNSDDVYYPQALKRVAELFAANPNVDVIYSMADYIDVNDRAYDMYPTEPWDFEWLKCTCFICQPAVFFRRSMVEQFGSLDPKLMYCMDYEYWLRLGAGGAKFLYLREKLAASRMYRENKTLRAQLDVRREINDMLQRLFGNVPDRWLLVYAHYLAESRVSWAPSSIFFAYLALQLVLAARRWNGALSTNMKGALMRYITWRKPPGTLLTIGLEEARPPGTPFVGFTWGHIHGVYADGWAGPSLSLQYGPGGVERFVAFEIQIPQWLPFEYFELVITSGSGKTEARYRFVRGESTKIHVPLGTMAGGMDLNISPSFRPIELPELLDTTDTRELTIVVRKIEAGEASKLDAFFPPKGAR